MGILSYLSLVVVSVDFHCGELYAGLCMLPIGTCVDVRHHKGDKCKVDVEHAVLSKSWTAWYSNAHVQIVSEEWFQVVKTEWLRISTPIEMKMKEGEQHVDSGFWAGSSASFKM